jgi:hypothetical protein
MLPVKDKIEFFFQLGWAPAKDAVWKGTDREIALGVNGMATEELEIVSQVGFEFNEKNLSFMLGMIYAW